MEEEILSCPICLKPYNAEKNQPHIIPTCGHTLCLGCLQTIINGSQNILKCPECKSQTMLTKGDESMFPRNYALMKQLEKKINKDFCNEHKSHLDLVCVDCCEKICTKCFFKGTHKNHNTEVWEDFENDINLRANDIDDWAKKIENHHVDVGENIQKEKHRIVSDINLKFNQLILMLQNKKREAISNVETHFNRLAQCKLNNGEPASKEEEMTALIMNWKERISKITIRWRENRDLQAAFKIKGEDMKKNIEDIKLWLNQDSLGSVLEGINSSYIPFYNKFTQHLEEFCSFGKALCQGDDDNNPEMDISEKKMCLNSPEIMSEKTFNHISEDLVLNFSEAGWLTITIPEEDSDRKMPTSYDRMTISQVTSLAIQGSDQIINEEIMNKIFLLLENMTHIDTLKIDFEEAEIDDECLERLMKKLSGFTELKSLTLNLSQFQYSSDSFSESFDKFAANLINFRQLELLDLRFVGCALVTNFSFAELSNSLLCMSGLRVLVLDFENCDNLGDGAVVSIAVTLGAMKNLRQISLYMDGWHITDRGFIQLGKELANLPELTSIKLSVEECPDITSPAVLVIVKLFSGLTNLKELFLNLKNCPRIDEACISQINETLAVKQDIEKKIDY